MKRVTLRQIIAFTVLTATLSFFVYYFISHPEVRERILSTPPLVLASIMILYMGTVVAIALITLATVKLCDISLGRNESLKLTAYSSLVNFFGPLQSGPAFRAVYLKKRHNVNLKKYAAATFVYYFLFGVLGLLFVASYWLDWRLGILAVLAIISAFVFVRSKPIKSRLAGSNLSGWYLLAFATVLQAVIMTAIYYVELKTLAPATSLHQAIIYSGAANMALFVSLTPGAIGFRESFLVFSQNLHQVDSTTIIAANILDRSMYIVLLSILALGVFVTHTKNALTADITPKKS